MLTFDPSLHEYRWNGRTVPSVTQLIGRLGPFAGVPPEILEPARQRGTFVHAMTEAFDLDDLDVEALPPQFKGYLDAWQRFLSECQPNWSSIEKPIYSERHDFAGTPDRVGTIATTRLTRSEPSVFDIKTGKQPSRYWGLQTAAYRTALIERGEVPATARRYTIQLFDDGRYRLLPWNDPDDWRTFAAINTLRIWTERA